MFQVYPASKLTKRSFDSGYYRFLAFRNAYLQAFESCQIRKSILSWRMFLSNIDTQHRVAWGG